MKHLILITLIAFVSLPMVGQNKNAKASLEVDGVCLMCKLRIEKASIKTKGIKTAKWDMASHVLQVVYDERKTDLTTLKKNIAAVGHDTDEFKASDEAYNGIDDCCKYRDPQVVDDHKMSGDDGKH